MLNIYKYLPVKKEELSKFLVISSMMILIIFIYSTQRIVKDTIVVSYMGAELISAIKLYGVLPSAVLITLVYMKLSSILNKTTLFHLFNLFFISYFVGFTFVIFPSIENFQLDFSVASSQFPVFRFFFIMLENWTYSLYYIFSELWGSVMLALIFWHTANQVFQIKEAKRIYPLFGLVGQIGMLLSGKLTGMFTDPKYMVNGWQESLNYINSSVAIGGVVLSILFWTLANILVPSSIINAETQKKKSKIGFFEGLKYVFKSKYIGLITVLVLCYGCSINLVEGVWKAQARVVYPNPQDYAGFMSHLQTYTGLVCMVAMLTGSYIMSIITWRTAALLTPIIMVVTGGVFFAFSIYQVEVMDALPFLTIVPIVVAVYAGLIQNILSKATKYAFFDATKEMAYIPLDEALKSKGKAAADVIGGRLGKSGGAIIQQGMLAAIPGATLVSLSPSLFGIFLVMMVVWFIAVFVLAKEFNKISGQEKAVPSNQ